MSQENRFAKVYWLTALALAFLFPVLCGYDKYFLHTGISILFNVALATSLWLIWTLGFVSFAHDKFVDGPRDVTGTLSFFPQDWKFLAFTLGSNVDAGAPSPFTHTMSETNSADGNAFTSGVFCPFVFWHAGCKSKPGRA